MALATNIPARPDGLELIGEMAGSGYRNPPSLVRRSDGQTLQLTPLLYAVLEAVDGRRGYAEIAEHVSERTGRSVSASDVETLVERQLRPQALLLGADGSVPRLKRSNPLLGLRFKLALTDPAVTRRITDPFTVLFHPIVWVPLVTVFGALSWWLLIDHGLASATYQAFAKPSLLLLIVAVTLLSAGFHEFGHAAAARRGGAQPGVIGAGLYLMWPAFYTDVTDSYRLGRFGRVRTDLGGLYFNVIVAVAIAAIWWLTRWDALLLVVAAQILQMVRQLTPLVRFDGYHVLADLTGVPDLFSRIGPILASFLPGRCGDPRVTQLKAWARVLVTAWVLVVVPVLAFSILAMVLAAPRLVGTAVESFGRERDAMAHQWGAGQSLDAAGSGLAMAVVVMAVLAMGLMAGRIVIRLLKTLWRRTEGRPARRAGAGVLVLAMGAALAFAWWPSPQRYRPIQPYEGGTLLDVAAAPLAAAGLAVPAAPSSTGGRVTTVLPRSGDLPTEAHPELALVLVPPGSSSGGGGVNPAWVFPFNRPLPPKAGDNQALAVNTTSGTATYDVAVAMVWVTGDDPVLNTNEAYAFANCSNCVTVSVAFQVVVIVGNANVIVPQNLSGAVNYDCFECITAAIASQLVVTIDSLPDAAQQVALADIWAKIQAFAKSIPTLPLADVMAQLEDYKSQILAILDVSAVPEPSGSPAPSGSPGASPGGSADASPSPSAGSTEPSPGPSEGTPSETGGTEPTPGATPAAPTEAPTTNPSQSDPASAAPDSPSPAP
ncbi:MAG: hypothetical protein ACJ77B_10485 [Chloroflexota bacterium]